MSAIPATQAIAGHDAAIVFAAAALAPLAVYLATLHPGLPTGDSGELIAAAWTGGIAHPPGYPLYVMLGGAWAHALPFATPALALNAFSALCMAVAAGVLALVTLRLNGSRAGAVFGGWSFALFVPAWKYALVAEVFALNALLAAALLWLLAVSCDEQDARRRRHAMLALVFITILGLSHHHTLLLLGVPASLVAFVWVWRADQGHRLSLLVQTATAKLLALLPLVWLPLASHRADAQVWGDASSARGLLSLLLRDDYGTFRLDPLQAGMHADRSHVLIWLEALPHAMGVLPLLLALVGAIVVARRRLRVALALAGYLALQVLFFTRVGFPSDAAWLRGVIERFYILPALAIALCAGAGAAWLLAQLPRGARPAAACAILLAALVVPLATHAHAVSQRGNHFAEALGRGMLASAPPRAVLFVQGDLQHNALVYLTRVRGLRPDVTVLDQELMTYAWYVRRTRASDPDVLPALGAAQRLTLRDGRSVEGWAIARADSTVDMLTESGHATMRASDVVVRRPARAESLFAATRAGFRGGWLKEPSEDRYSGLPGTRNLLWLDHLAARRPVAFVGLKEDSWSLRYALTPIGFVALASERGREISAASQAEASLRVFEETPMDAYFRECDPTSFEAAERWRFAAVAARAALVLSQPEAVAAMGANPAGWRRLQDFAQTFEALDPTPDAPCLRAIGFLRVFGSGFADRMLARRDLERYLASGHADAETDIEARDLLARLQAEPVH